MFRMWAHRPHDQSTANRIEVWTFPVDDEYQDRRKDRAGYQRTPIEQLTVTVIASGGAAGLNRDSYITRQNAWPAFDRDL